MMQAKHGRLTVGATAAVVLAATTLFWWKQSQDSCTSAGRVPMQVNGANPYVFACDDAIYLPAPSSRARFKRVGNTRPDDIQVLPFKYVRVSGRLYYVSFTDEGIDENRYSLRPIEEIDVSSMEILDEHHVQDRRNSYTVLRDYYLIEPRKLP